MQGLMRIIINKFCLSVVAHDMPPPLRHGRHCRSRTAAAIAYTPACRRPLPGWSLPPASQLVVAVHTPTGRCRPRPRLVAAVHAPGWSPPSTPQLVAVTCTQTGQGTPALGWHCRKLACVCVLIGKLQLAPSSTIKFPQVKRLRKIELLRRFATKHKHERVCDIHPIAHARTDQTRTFKPIARQCTRHRLCSPFAAMQCDGKRETAKQIALLQHADRLHHFDPYASPPRPIHIPQLLPQASHLGFCLCYVLATFMAFRCRRCTGRVNSPPIRQHRPTAD